MRRKFLSPAIGVDVAAVLATSAGTCSWGGADPPVTTRPPVFTEPLPLLPEAIIPFEVEPANLEP